MLMLFSDAAEPWPTITLFGTEYHGPLFIGLLGILAVLLILCTAEFMIQFTRHFRASSCGPDNPNDPGPARIKKSAVRLALVYAVVILVVAGKPIAAEFALNLPA